MISGQNNSSHYELNSIQISEVESILCRSFPMIDYVTIPHLRSFFILFPKAFYNMKKTQPAAKFDLQKLLRVTTYPLEINRLRRTDMLRTIFEAAVLLLIQRLPEYKRLLWHTTQQFLDQYSHYSEFQGLGQVELKKLLDFRNLVVAAKVVIHPKIEYYMDLAV